MSKKIMFVSTLGFVPWGGSELLWSEAALRLVGMGHAVSASVAGWAERASQVSALARAGVVVKERGEGPSGLGHPLAQKASSALFRRVSLGQFSRWVRQEQPDLVCVSCGSPGDDMSLIERCVRAGRPYVVIIQAHAEHLWPDDRQSARWSVVFEKARRVFFVSERNKELVETQIGGELLNARIVRNPFNVRWDASPPWPGPLEPARLACVGRLDPMAKGQDLLFQALASEPWRSRPVELSLFGKGPMEEGLRRLAKRLGLEGRVRFCGHEPDVERIWATHHALVLPSRFEGLPLAIVEAMLCARVVIVTDVAGNAELVKDGVTGFVAEAATERHLRQTLERAWEKREDWESMGKRAARSIRELIPKDPAAEFARELEALADSP